jgi:hypothetical protein
MDHTRNFPLGASITYPMFDLLFARGDFTVKIPSKVVYGLAALGGMIFFRKIGGFLKSVVKKFVRREHVAVTRNDGRENFEDRWALITGADGLMGRAYARELGERNFNLLLVGHDEEALEDLTREIMSGDIGVTVKPIVVSIKDNTNMDEFRR